ncbi:MAG: hypothetical protein EOP11_11765 [Proteobacteria bacterium]|nr:MAG: hypothetical protein EOP11_11765 [Pseudomonadota bacterium]
MRISLLFLTLFLTACAGSSGRAPAAEDPKQLRAFAADGEFAAQARFAFDPESKAEVLRGFLSYEPAASAQACKKVGWVQVARLAGANSLSGGKPSGEAVRSELRTDSGFFLVHRLGACEKAKPCSPYFADHWPYGGANAFGSVMDEGPARVATPASMEAYPFGRSKLGRIELESCAICDDSGEVAGCVRWGGEQSAAGERSISRIRFRAEPSESFRKARSKFKAYYGK